MRRSKSLAFHVLAAAVFISSSGYTDLYIRTIPQFRYHPEGRGREMTLSPIRMGTAVEDGCRAAQPNARSRTGARAKTAPGAILNAGGLLKAARRRVRRPRTGSQIKGSVRRGLGGAALAPPNVQ